MLICKKSLIFTLYNFFVQHPAPDNQIGAGLGRQQHVSSVLTHFVPPAKWATLLSFFDSLNQHVWFWLKISTPELTLAGAGSGVQTRHVLTLHYGWYWPIQQQPPANQMGNVFITPITSIHVLFSPNNQPIKHSKVMYRWNVSNCVVIIIEVS